MPVLVALIALVAASDASVMLAARVASELNSALRKDWATSAGRAAWRSAWPLVGGAFVSEMTGSGLQSRAPATPRTVAVASAPLIRIHLRVLGSTVKSPQVSAFPGGRLTRTCWQTLSIATQPSCGTRVW